MVNWYIEGDAFGNCNCNSACPCQFEELPTHGHCRGFEVVRIDQGHFGELNLAGLRFALLYAWPGPVFEGGGEMQMVIDERASEDQRAALARVLAGEETREGATHWWVFRQMSQTLHPPVYRSIDFEVDIDARSARVRIPGVLESSGEPIRPPHSAGTHRVQIRIPQGIEFEVADIGRASSETGADAAVNLQLHESYGQFNRLRHSGGGVVRA